MYGYNSEKKDTNMRTKSDMSFKVKLNSIAESPTHR